MVQFPKIIQIETSLTCNSHCVFCPHDEMKREPQLMPDELWKKIIDESRGKGIIYRPFMVNEPFTDTRLPEIIEYIRKDPTAKVELNSNGNIPVKADIERILKAGVDWVRFSIDGFTQETYKKSGRGGTLDKVYADVRRFIETRNKLGVNCFVEVRMIDLDVNKHEQEEYVNFWSKYANKATITALYEWPWSGQETYFPAPCPKCREEMFFMTNGDAVLCCWDAFGRGVVGNASSESVEEIWLGENMKKHKDWLNNGDRGKILLCSKCDAYKTYDFSNWQGY